MPSSKLVAGLEAGLDAAIDAQLGIGVAEELDASRRSRRLLGGPPHAMRSTFGGELRNLTAETQESYLISYRNLMQGGELETVPRLHACYQRQANALWSDRRGRAARGSFKRARE